MRFAIYGESLRWLSRLTCRAALFLMLALFAGASAANAQSPNPGATGPAPKSQEGFAPGWALGTRFEGSSSSDGSVFNWSTALGYNFSRHFGVGLAVPYYFVGTPSLIQERNPTAVSGYGLGDVGADLRWNFPGRALNYNSTIHLTAPTGDEQKGLSTGHVMWNLSNRIAHGWGIFSPFIEAGVGNTVADTNRLGRVFKTFGYNAAFEAGTEIDAGRVSFSASAYDVVPWGAQTVISRVFRCPPGPKCVATQTIADRKNHLLESVSIGDASLTRDNGFNAGADFSPLKNVALDFNYSRSVPLHLDSFSFGISFDLSSLLRPRPAL